MKKEYKPNHSFYLNLLFIFGLIIFLAINVSLLKLDDIFVSLISAVISFATGGLASVVVAWLIDLSNCAKKNYEMNLNRYSIYFLLVTNLSGLICVFQKWCHQYDESSQDLEMDWSSWAHRFINLRIFSKIQNEDRDYYNFYVNEANKSLERLKDIFPSFKASGIIGPFEDARVSSLVQSFHILELYFKNQDEDQENYKILIDEIKNLIEENPNFHILNTIKSNNKNFYNDYLSRSGANLWEVGKNYISKIFNYSGIKYWS